MATVKPFKGLRPPKDIAKELSCLPYDVMNSEEAAQIAAGNPYSLLHITKSEIDCKKGIDIHSKEVYDKSVANFRKFIEKGWLVQDSEEHFYIYAQTMNGRTQYGIVGCAACQDYFDGLIKQHELTRPDKEDDRMIHIRVNNANLEPVFFSYKAVPEIDKIVGKIVYNQEPEYDFVSDDGFGHHFWIVRDKQDNLKIEKLFAEKVPYTYVADGHHRTAAASRIGKERMAANPNHTGNEDYNFFMAVHFPDNQLAIIDYNRLVKDLNDLSESDFMLALGRSFEVYLMGTEIYKPTALHEFSMYLSGKWYRLVARKGTYDDKDPIGVLDVTILSKHLFERILNVTDLRTTQRVDFVGGIRGLEELKRRVDSGEMKAAFALYPVSMQQLINIADSGNIMPPKTTWFEPKLRSGLVIHQL
ncbi:MAG TPA: DUF1015 domain-containing protein [Marinilabiliaceae bacterium]|nr:DUF1015 domain-containing protein [Marinilabiliaceae bacterium]HBX88821.1 DUF1015 domain-containing protein [Marinilabiliaceae bacterium]